PLEEVVPDVAEAVTPEVVIPLPQPKPVEAPVEAKTKKQAKAKEPAEAKAKKPVEKAKNRPKKEKAAPPRTTASLAATPAARAAAPKSAKAVAASRGDAKKWNSQLTRWINRHKRYPKAARARRSEGTVRVSFMVAGSGRVTSVRITGSSGDPDLDRSVLDLLQGATVPAPPEGVSSRVDVPLTFSLR
ncbi:energy transducer TonB, partial [Mesorhizobium sp. M5C.F.Ca.IN.020.32.2.1]